MMIELFGLPASGKTTAAAALEQAGWCRPALGGRAELLARAVLAHARHPARAARLLWLVARHAGSARAFYLVFMNIYLRAFALRHKALRMPRAVLDQGPLQLLLSLDVRPLSPAALAALVRGLPKPDYLFALEVAEDERQRRLAERPALPRAELGAAYARAFGESRPEAYARAKEILAHALGARLQVVGPGGAADVARALPLRVLYVANVRLPTEKAHGAQIMKTCEALAGAGVFLELVVPARRSHIKEDPFAYYGISKRFPLTRLAVWDTVGWGMGGFLFESLQFAVRAARHTRRARPDVVYSRDELVLAVMSFFVRAPIVWESHTGAWNAAARRVARRAPHIVAISQGLKDFYIERGVDARKIAVAHDGVACAAFDVPQSPQEARQALGLPQEGPLVVYAGSRQAGKGVEVLEAARALLSSVEVRIISGEPYARMPLYLRAADVLVLPNSARSAVSSCFTSPMKLFEYLAAGKPIVASDVPAVREILHEGDAVLVAPDDPAALAAGIAKALDPALAASLAARAAARAGQYDWRSRAARIIEMLRTL